MLKIYQKIQKLFRVSITHHGTILGYNLPRFWEVRVCTEITDCFNQTSPTNPGLLVETCYNRTDVIKTELRENEYYISVNVPA